MSSKKEPKPPSSSSTSSSNTKKLKLDFTNKLKLNPILEDPKLMNQLKESWLNNLNYEDPTVLVTAKPFLHCEIHNFVQYDEFDGFIEKIFSELVFQEKLSDLFQFKQSYDLKSLKNELVKELSSFFQTSVFKFVSELTGYPLNGHVDLFLSDYRQTDHLLCHDDELESRRIAFILYFNKDWKTEYGGLLDLFNCPDKDNDFIEPTTVSKSILPEFNKLVLFSVTHKSFHQVTEIIEPNVKRLALSGWFIGAPIERPKFRIKPIKQEPLIRKSITTYQNFIKTSYTSESTLLAINKQLEEDSEIMLVDFLNNDCYSKLCHKLDEAKEQDWVQVGPISLEFSYQLNNLAQDRRADDDLLELFKSIEFIQFLEKITEFPFEDGKVRVSSQLNKYESKCYKLLKSNHMENEDEESTTETADSDHSSDSEEEEEEEEEPQFIDVLYFTGQFKWNSNFGGQVVYTDGNGDHLVSIEPQPNSLAIIIRTKSVHSYVQYINSLAKHEKYYLYSATYSFENNN